MAFLIARSILSLGMFSARAAIIAARSRGFIAGSGRPIFAETVISRASLPNSFDLAASWRPLRCMMFLNCECPAMARSCGSSDHRSAQQWLRADRSLG
jgi:hypothetical protein